MEILPDLLRRSRPPPPEYPDALRCFAIPYGPEGIVGDIFATYALMAVTGENTPLMPWRKLRHPHLTKWLAFLQGISCFFLQIITLVKCGHRAELVLLPVGRMIPTMMVATIVMFVANERMDRKKKGMVEQEPVADRAVDVERALPEAGSRDDSIPAAAVGTEPHSDSDITLPLQGTSTPLLVETQHPIGSDNQQGAPSTAEPEVILGVPNKPYRDDDIPVTESSSAESSTTNTVTANVGTQAQNFEKGGCVDSLFILMGHYLLVFPLGFVGVPNFLILITLMKKGGEGQKTAQTVFIVMCAFLACAAGFLLWTIWNPIRQNIKREGSVKRGLRTLTVRKVLCGDLDALRTPATALVYLSVIAVWFFNWVLVTATGGMTDMRKSWSINVMVRYWLYFGLSKLMAFAI